MVNKEQKTILVVGGAGFIGSHTVVELLEAGYHVIVLDNLSNAAAGKGNVNAKGFFPPSLKRVKGIVPEKCKENVAFVFGNYADKDVLRAIFSSNDIFAVIHFGGFKAVGESKQFPLMYYENNLMGTLILIKIMEEFNTMNLIFSSSATVYTEVAPEELPYTEDSKTGSCTCAYASSKHFLEEIFQDIARANKKWNFISLRYFNPVGAHPTGEIGEDPKGIPNNLMPYISQVAVGRREFLAIFGTDYPTPDGTGIRDYIHIVDLAKGHVAALKAFETVKGFRAFNLGSGTGTSVMEIIDTFERVNGIKIPTQRQGRRAGDVSSMYCDPKRARDELGWVAEKSVDEMCRDLWKFQKNNPNGLGDDE